ncbi:hypothetical protein K7711_08905 [Nocardia sp. CA2R105]|uniref:hypothetical protein n=1 Tax=Nocardia coffeae TaxID=2873381 RepID=UPI001CA6A258|nr:hypothetical protein [Nocardia coffeae]MBY8856592.1 hypothetical protein [Nocardia coffeae]
MVMSLQDELEPLLIKLASAANSLFEYNISQPPEPTPEQYQQAVAGFKSDLSELLVRFRGYYSLDGPDLAQIADQFAVPSDRATSPTGSSAYCCIVRAKETVRGTESLVSRGQWHGEGTKKFFDNFLRPFQQAAQIHALCARELAISAKALADAVELAKESVIWICKSLLFYLGGGSAPGLAPGVRQPGGQDVAGFESILFSTVSLFSAVLAPELDAADVIISIGGWITGMQSESDIPFFSSPFEVEPNGPIPAAIPLIYSAWTALNEFDQNLAEFDTKIDQGLEKDLTDSELFDNPLARLGRPQLQSSAYQQLNSKGIDDTTDPISNTHDPVIIAIAQLFEVGYRLLPEAAEQYGIAAGISSGAHIIGVDHQFPMAVAKFNEAAHLLDGLVTTVTDALTDSAAAIVKAASTYRDVDAYEAGQIRELQREFVAPVSSQSSFQAQEQTPPIDN